MKGRELRAIRLFNQISQIKLAHKLGYSTTDTIRKAEQQEFLPHSYVVAIKELVGIDFTNQKILDEYIQKLPEDIHHKYKAGIFKRFF